MKSQKVLSRLRCAVALLGCGLAVARTAASQEKVVYAFAPTPVFVPESDLLADPSGNFFGVASEAVYELSPTSSGGWEFHVVHTLIGPADFPGGTLARDSAGNLYGATWQGGAHGAGYVYQLSPSSSGTWHFAVLHSFTGTDGASASYSMVFDRKGNLYGGTHSGGSFHEGVAFELSPSAGGAWTCTVLHQFSAAPQTGVIFDNEGNLFGGNSTGIWKLTPNGDGTWTESTAYKFNSADGFNPLADLTWDAAGNLYGTNQAGGQYFGGTAFKLTPNSGGGWTSTVLHSFNQNKNDGYYPYGGLTLDSDGNIYGTTAYGGSGNYGIAFKLTPTGTGEWTESVLHGFGPNGSEGGTVPENSLYLGATGNLYGVTHYGGNTACSPPVGCGVVYEIVP